MKKQQNNKSKLLLNSKQNDSKEEWKFIGYVGLFGPRIEEFSKKHMENIPKEYIKKQEERDKGVHHITLMLKPEMKTCISKLNSIDDFKNEIKSIKETNDKIKDEDLLLVLISKVITDDFIDLGLGKVSKQGNEAYFKVIQWDSASHFRKVFGLEKKDFHITVGFKDSDIHDVHKDETTLLKF